MDEPRPLETLHRNARRLQAVVCLTSTADARDRSTASRPYSRQDGHTLSTLAVVRPARSRDLCRFDQLKQGATLVAHQLHRDDRLDTIAAALLDELAPLLTGRT